MNIKKIEKKHLTKINGGLGCYCKRTHCNTLAYNRKDSPDSCKNWCCKKVFKGKEFFYGDVENYCELKEVIFEKC